MRSWDMIGELAECCVGDQMDQESVLTQGQAFQSEGGRAFLIFFIESSRTC